ncbi:hypothetical protein C8F01DRAFT_1155782, partial [Mycena amicta]
MQLTHWQSFVLLALAATGITYASPTAPAAPVSSPIVSAETEAKLAAIGAQLRNTTARGLDKRTVRDARPWPPGEPPLVFFLYLFLLSHLLTKLVSGHLRHGHQSTRYQLHWLRRLLGCWEWPHRHRRQLQHRHFYSGIRRLRPGRRRPVRPDSLPHVN